MTDIQETEPLQEDAAPPPAREPDTPRRAGLTALLAVLVYILFDAVLPLIHVPIRGLRAWEFLALMLAPTAVFMFLQLWMTRTFVDLGWPLGRVVFVAVASAAAWFLILKFAYGTPHMPLALRETIYLARTIGLSLMLTIGLAFLGILLARIIREPNVLLPVALIAMPIDYVGAMTSVGFTHSAVQHAPEIVSAVSIHVPTVRGLGIIPMIGPGDALFIAFFLAVAKNLHLNERGTFWWMYGLLTLTMFIVLLTPWPIAALVPMGLAVIIANFRYFHFKRAEVFAMIYAMIMIFVVVGSFYLASHHFLFRGK